MIPNFAAWAILAPMLGFLAYLAPPVLVAPSLPIEHRARVTGMYFGFASAAYRRYLLVRRQHTGYKIFPSTFDTEKEGEKITIGGEDRHYYDIYNWMSRHGRYPVGLVYEPVNLVVHPMLAEVGEQAKRLDAAGKRTWRTQNGARVGNAHVKLPSDARLLELADNVIPMPGSGKAKDASSADEFTEKSQQGFKSKPAFEMVTLLIAMAAGAGLAYFVNTNGGGAVPDGPVMPTSQILVSSLLVVVRR